jgi:hypothetical protein
MAAPDVIGIVILARIRLMAAIRELEFFRRA